MENALRKKTEYLEQQYAGNGKRFWADRLLSAAVFVVFFYDLAYYFQGFYPDGLFQLLTHAVRVSMLFEGIVLLGVVLSAQRRASLLLLLNLCWLILTRLILGSFSGESVIHWAARYVCFFGGLSLLSVKQRDTLCALITLGLAVPLALWASVGVFAALTGRAVGGVCLAAEQEASLVYLSFFDIHRNKSASYFVCTAGLLLYQAHKRRAPFRRGFAAFFLPLTFCTVALQHSRSNYLAFSVLLGLTLVCSLQRLRFWPRGRAGDAAALCALTLFVAVFYTGLDAVGDGFATLSGGMRPEAGAALVLSDHRNTLTDSRTLTGRTEIWRAGLRTIRENPSIALIGLPMGSIMTRVNELTAMPHVQMHNILFQQLMTAGIPGLLLYCLFLLSLFKRIIPLFRRGGEERAELQVIGALLLSLMVYGVFEPLLSPTIQLASLLFSMAAGLLTEGSGGRSKERSGLSPTKSR